MHPVIRTRLVRLATFIRDCVRDDNFDMRFFVLPSDVARMRAALIRHVESNVPGVAMTCMASADVAGWLVVLDGPESDLSVSDEGVIYQTSKGAEWRGEDWREDYNSSFYALTAVLGITMEECLRLFAEESYTGDKREVRHEAAKRLLDIVHKYGGVGPDDEAVLTKAIQAQMGGQLNAADRQSVPV